MPAVPPWRAALASTIAVATLALAPLSAQAASEPAELVEDITITGPDGSAFGATASQASCDVNGNGIPDLAVGMYMTFGMTPETTSAYVLLDAGETATVGDIEDLDPVRIIDTSMNYMGGADVRCAGDTDGDGFDDLVVVVQGTAAFVLFGAADFSDVSLDDLGARGRTVLGSITRGNGIGDVDGDGFDEVALTDTDGGVTILNLDELPAESELSAVPGPRVSGDGIDLVSVSRAGDMNGDGREDLAVGAASWTAPGATSFGTGAIWVITDLSSDVTVGEGEIPGFRIDGPPRGYDLLGTSTVGLGDIDGDGYDDLLIGGESDAPKNGSAVVVTGGPDGENVVTDPLSTDAPAVRSASSGTQRGWWVNGIAPDDHFGHAVGAVRMDGWSVILSGSIDGSPDAEREKGGYAIAIDSRALVAGELPVSETGVVEVAALMSGTVAGATPIEGEIPEQNLGRSFADLTADPAGTRVTFAIGAPALFSVSTLPSVRIIALDIPVPVQPEPGDADGGSDDSGDGSGGSDGDTGGSGENSGGSEGTGGSNGDGAGGSSDGTEVPDGSDNTPGGGSSGGSGEDAGSGAGGTGQDNGGTDQGAGGSDGGANASDDGGDSTPTGSDTVDDGSAGAGTGDPDAADDGSAGPLPADATGGSTTDGGGTSAASVDEAPSSDAAAAQDLAQTGGSSQSGLLLAAGLILLGVIALVSGRARARRR